MNKEMQKLQDVKFYLENYTKIKLKKGGLAPFKLNEAQKDLFNTLRVHNRVMILKARQLGFCLEEHTKVLLSNLKWIELKNIKIGDSIISVDENKPGNCKQRKMRTAIVENKFNFKTDTLKIILDNGQSLIGTLEHKMMTKKWECSTDVVWKKFSDMKIGTSVRYITKPWEYKSYKDGWFSGMLDGEGSISKPSRTGVSLNVSQVDGPVLNRLFKYVKNNNLTYRVEVDKRKPETSSKFGSKPVYKIVINKMDELFEIIGKTRPSRFLSRKWWEGKALPNNGWAKIVSIENYGKCNVVDLQTSEKTYIANGFVSHNSTAVTGYFYHKTIMNPGVTTVLVGYNQKIVSELLDKVKTFYNTTPLALRPTLQYDSKYELSFPKINSKILVLPSSENVGRGFTINFCLITELSSWDKAEEKMAGLEESIPEEGIIVIESTPKGVANLFHRMWMTENEYVKKKYGWWWGYTKEQMDKKRKSKGPQIFAQEYGLEFLASGHSVFESMIILQQRRNILKVGDVRKEKGKKDFIVYKKDGWTIYREPEEDGLYVCGGDVAEGIEGGDYSVAIIWNRKTGEEVAMWRGLIAPDRFGEILNKKGREYNNALMVVEINNHGLTTVTVLKQLIYPSMYFRQAKLETLGTTTSDRIGWKTTKVTRPLLIDDFIQMARDKEIVIHSKILLDEMSVFVYDDNGNMVPQSGFFDDTIFSAGIGLQGFKVLYDKKLDQINYKQHLPVNFSY